MGINIMLLVMAAVTGGLAVGLWMHSDVVHYRAMYERVKTEKKAMAEEYNKRLEALGKTLGVYTVMEELDISHLDPVVMPPLEPSERTLDTRYE